MKEHMYLNELNEKQFEFSINFEKFLREKVIPKLEQEFLKIKIMINRQGNIIEIKIHKISKYDLDFKIIFNCDYYRGIDFDDEYYINSWKNEIGIRILEMWDNIILNKGE